jgi:MinD-like ATPase involved in chromosome partitioning or flagellar assembly
LKAEVQWKVAEDDAVSESVERGTPIVLQKRNEVSRTIRQLATALAHSDGVHRAEEAELVGAGSD